MKVLLFLNGKEGCQTGIEDGFNSLLKDGKLFALKYFYFEDFAKKNSEADCLDNMLNLSKSFLPDLIIFFHISKFPINKNLIYELRNLSSKPHLVYDEGDMYGSWAKPITRQMKLIMRAVDVVSVRGLGKYYRKVKKYNKNVIYTPHHNDIYRFDSNVLNNSRKKEIILIGNKVKPKFLSFIRRLPGAKEREKFVKKISKVFPQKFKLYGNGWSGIIGNQGPIAFYKQNEIYNNSWLTVAYEHYPEIPYYFSNRLPIALMNGSLYVCHYHEGYEKMFPNCDFIFFFKTNEEAIDIIIYLFSLSDEELRIRSEKAREFALRQYTPIVIWNNFFNNVIKNINQTSNTL